MSRYCEPTPDQVAGYAAWVEARPPHVRAVAERFEPWSLYRIGAHGHRVIVREYNETNDGVRLTVLVLGRFNFVTFDRRVFGIDPDELVPCDPPSEDELTGTVYLQEDEVKRFIEIIKPQMRRAARRATRDTN